MGNYRQMVLFFFIFSAWYLFCSSNGQQFVCPAQFGDFPNFNTEKCTTYFKCVNGVPVLTKCPEKKQFDFVFGTCKKDKDVNCHLQKEMIALSAATLGGGAFVAPGVLQGRVPVARGGGQLGNQFAIGQWGIQGQGPQGPQVRWQGQFPAQGPWQGQLPNQQPGRGWVQRGGQGQFGRAFPGQRGVQGQFPGQWQGNGFQRNGFDGRNNFNNGFGGVGNRPNFPGFRAGIGDDGRRANPGFNGGWQPDGFGRWNGNGRGINNNRWGQGGLPGQNPGVRDGGRNWFGNRNGVNPQGGRRDGQGNANGLNPRQDGRRNGQRNGNGFNPLVGGGWNGPVNGNGFGRPAGGWDGQGNPIGNGNGGFRQNGFGVNGRDGRRLFLDETPIPPIGFFPFQLNGNNGANGNNRVRAFGDGEAQNIITDEEEHKSANIEQRADDKESAKSTEVE